MKNLLTLIGLVLLAGAANAQVPTYAVQSLVSHKAIAASTATNLNAVIDCRKQASVALMIVATNTLNSAAADGTDSLVWSRSLDGISYETNLQTVAWAPKGLDPQIIITNLVTQGAGYIRIHWATNSAGGSTNIGDFNLSYAVKISAP